MSKTEEKIAAELLREIRQAGHLSQEDIDDYTTHLRDIFMRSAKCTSERGRTVVFEGQGYIATRSRLFPKRFSRWDVHSVGGLDPVSFRLKVGFCLSMDRQAGPYVSYALSAELVRRVVALKKEEQRSFDMIVPSCG